MEDRTRRALGALSALGGVLAVVASAPSRWYGVPRTDAYVFSPPAFTPLWVERVVMPVVAALAAVLLVVGVAGLLARDRPTAGRLRRWGGYVAAAGLGAVALVLLLDAATPGTVWASGGTASPFVLLGALLVVLGGAGVALPALAVMGLGYLRADRRVVGTALVVGPAATLLVFFSTWLVEYAGVGGLPVVAPLAATFVVVGHDLWTTAGPVAGPGDAADGGDGGEGGESGAAGMAGREGTGGE